MQHPLSQLFDIADFTTQTDDPIPDYAVTDTAAVAAAQAENPTPQPDLKDADDIENDKRLDEVYSVALRTFKDQTEYTEMIEPRYAARQAEVAAQYLNIALQAVTSKAKVKADRKRNQVFIPHSNKTTNNLIVASRNEIMKMIDVDGQDHNLS